MNFRMDFGASTSSIDSSYLKVMPEIHVLLADHDADEMHTRRILEICQYRVTSVSFASDAIDRLRAGKTRFHLVIANASSPDGQCLQLVQEAATTETPIILTCWNENPLHVREAIELGVFMYLSKPLKIETMVSMWQHLLREDLRRKRDSEIFVKPTNDSAGGVVEKERRKKPKRAGDDVASAGKEARTKECMQWTAELHDEFVAAVEQLGDGRVFPKDIRDLMKVPGLTRMQIASHLQKCRNDNWRSPEERRAMMNQQQNNNTGGGTPSMDGETSAASPQSRPRRFGAMPKILYSHSKTRTASSDGGAPPQPHPVVDDLIPISFGDEIWVPNFQPSESAQFGQTSGQCMDLPADMNYC